MTKYMKYQIDQSGKVEDTNKLTIVAVADGKSKTLKISAKEKQKLIKVMRELDRPKKIFIYKMFAGLIFLLIKNERMDRIIIDKEYPGHEAFIKEIILQLLRGVKAKPPQIDFSFIGKQSLAHKIAIETFRGIRKADMIIKAKEVLALFYKFKP